MVGNLDESTRNKSVSDEVDAAGGGGGRATTKQPAPATTLTKRQLLKQRNTKNLIPQHPKIQNAQRRSTAYLRTAGLLNPIVPDVDLQAPELKFGRLLGCADQRVRHNAVMKLRSYLQARCQLDSTSTTTNNNTTETASGISELDLLKIWKGLWFTLYLADKVVVQDELAKHLSKLLWCVAGTEEEDAYAGQCYLEMCPDDEDEDEGDDDDDVEEGEHDDDEEDEDVEVIMEEIANTFNEENEQVDSSDEDAEVENNQERGPSEDHEEDVDDQEDLNDMMVPHCRGAHLASLFVRTFLRTVRREWGNMDKHRVDKFYTLMRYMMHEVLQYMAQRHWDLGIIRLFNDAVFEEALRHTPNGLRYHLIDLVLEELSAVNAKAPIPLTEATFLDVLEPYFALAQTGCGDDTIHQRAVDNVLLKFLERYSVARTDTTLDESLVLDQVHVGTVAEFIFDIASDEETRNKYRKNLYDVHKAYAKRLKHVKDVDLQHGEDAAEDVVLCGLCACGEEDELVTKEEEKESTRLDDEVEIPPSKIEKEAKKKNEKNKNKVALAESEQVSKKQRKRKAKADEEQKGEVGAAATHVSPESKNKEVGESPKLTPDEHGTNSKKKRKKAKKNNAQSDAKEDLLLSGQASNHVEKPAVKKQDVIQQAKKGKGQTKVDGSTSSGAGARLVTEEELLISAKAQREAKLALKKREEAAKAAKAKEDEKDSDDAKKVKFGQVNLTRSWKISMKRLREMDSPTRTNVTPERGILLNKGAKIKKKSEKTKGKRRRAVDYF